MGLENMRSGHSRCSNLAIALAIVSFLLTYNWWSLSTQNYELLRQLDDVSDQLKLCSEEKSSCELKRNSVEQQLRESETRIADLKVTEIKSTDFIKKLKNDVAEQTKLAEKNEKDAGYCKTELNSLKNFDDSKTTMLASMRLEKEALDAKLLEVQEKVKDLELALKAAKSTSNTLKIYAPSEGNPTKLKIEQDETDNGPVNGGNHDIENNAKEVEDTINIPK